MFVCLFLSYYYIFDFIIRWTSIWHEAVADSSSRGPAITEWQSSKFRSTSFMAKRIRLVGSLEMLGVGGRPGRTSWISYIITVWRFEVSSYISCLHVEYTDYHISDHTFADIPLEGYCYSICSINRLYLEFTEPPFFLSTPSRSAAK